MTITSLECLLGGLFGLRLGTYHCLSILLLFCIQLSFEHTLDRPIEQNVSCSILYRSTLSLLSQYLHHNPKPEFHDRSSCDTWWLGLTTPW